MILQALTAYYEQLLKQGKVEARLGQPLQSQL